MNWLLDRFLGAQIEKETQLQLRKLRIGPSVRSRQKALRLLSEFAASNPVRAELGFTAWGGKVSFPVEELTGSFGLITGSTGAGKTRFALLLIRFLLSLQPYARSSFSVLDPKGDLFFGTLFLIKRRLADLRTSDPLGYELLRDKIVVIDFSSQNPISSYNLLAPWKGVDAEFFAANRADLLLDLLEGSDALSLGATSVLEKLILLLSEYRLPITRIGDLVHDEGFRRTLVGRSASERVRDYFNRQFANVPAPTIQAIDRRIEALFSSSAVRGSISGPIAPDFRSLQDQGKIVLVNCFGETISRSARRLLQAIVLSDVSQSVFSRRQKERAHLFIADEAQNFFRSRKLRDNMGDLLTMSRSFGAFFLFLTQNMSTAVQDRRILDILYTNIRWAFSMRGEPSDCEFLKGALPVTGRMKKPNNNPFETPAFYSLNEERNLRLSDIANLPDRQGYLWFKAMTDEAIRLRTADLPLPDRSSLHTQIRPLLEDPNFGDRISRRAFEQIAGEREREILEKARAAVLPDLEEAYRRRRG